MNTMQKKLLALALLAGLHTSPVFAQAEEVVVGTIVNRLPELPKAVKIGTEDIPINWETADASLFNTAFKNIQVKGRGIVNGKETEVKATVWTLPDNLVYLIDAGRSASGKSQIYDAAKSLRGDALLNERPDRRCESPADLWGYVERTSVEYGKVHITPGEESDWATSFLSDDKDPDEGLAYRLTLKPGVYKITVAHVPCLNLTYSSWLRVNNARTSSKSLKTVATEDKRHPAVFVTHDLRLLSPTTFTYETDKLGGKEWENASISLIAVERVSSNVPAPLFSVAGGDYWEAQSLEIKHKSPEARIYYTLDGSKPGPDSPLYTSPLRIDKTARINAVAYIGNEESKVQTAEYVINTWAATATPFKLQGEQDVCNVKVNWMMRADADRYKIYRDGGLVGETTGDTFDDYALPVGKSYSYHVEAYKGDEKTASSVPQQTQTFALGGTPDVYDNLVGKYISQNKASKAQGMKIGDTYYLYRIDHIEKNVGGTPRKGWQVTESYSATGMEGSWSQPRELAFYPDVKFEGNAFHYNPRTGKVVLSSHYEDQQGYTAAKIYLAQITPKGSIEVGTMERPLGYDSRDQSLFIDDDNTAYLLSATRTNNDINIYRLDETWTRPVALVNTVFIGKHRETPAIVKKDGEYYFFSSKASGWYPSQSMYASATKLDGVWTPLRETGNSSTFDAQVNNIRQHGATRTTFGLWSYHWGAQRKHKTPAGNFPRISIVTFNAGYSSADYYRYIEFHEKEGMVPVQAGRNLTMNASATATAGNLSGAPAACITDGADMTSSPFYQGNAYPYSLTVDMQKEAVISEINLSTRLVNGSEAAYKFTIEGSRDGKTYEPLVDGNDNWQVGFLILPVNSTSAYRYLRLNVLRVVNVHNGNEAAWAEGVYELAAFGK